MPSRNTFVGTILSGNPVSATANNTLPGGLLGYDKQVTSVTHITSLTSIVSVTVTPNTNRMITVWASGMLTVPNPATVNTTTGASTARPVTAIASAELLLQSSNGPLNRMNVQVPLDGTDQGFVIFAYDLAPIGSQTYQLYVAVSGNSVPFVNIDASPQSPTLLFVKDEGPSSFA